jgi:hypothetical protein
MSSTTGIQNLLVNVIRPVYAYDATATLYTPKIEFANVDTYSGNVVSVLRADISDTNSNVYVGTSSGNTPATLTRNCFYNVAFGVSAGNAISNVSNSVYLGYNAGAGASSASSVIGIGANSGGNGTSNIFVGTGTKSGGSSNILIGHGIDLGVQTNRLQIGTTLYGDLSSNWVGIGTPSPINDGSNRFDVSGNAHVYGNLALNMQPGQRTLDVNGNFRADDGSATLDFNNGLLISSGGYQSDYGQVNGVSATQVVDIGPLKRGIILVSAQDTANATTHYDSKMVYCSDPTNGTYTTLMTSNVQAGDVYVQFQSGGSNIRFSNNTTARNIRWSITYLPLP